MPSINEFLGAVRNEGLMRTNRFAVYFSLPNAMGANLGSTDLRKVLLYCDQVKVPGLNFATAEAKTFGEIREMPYQRVFENIELSFYVDNSMSVKLLFDNWLAAVINPGSRTINYYNDYISDMVISIYDINENSRYQVTAYQCYPKTVSSIQMDYSNKDNMKLTVTFVSKYWDSLAIQNAPGVSPNTPSSLGGAFGQGIAALGNLLGGTPQAIPNTYFTNFNSYQTGIQSFENGRSSLFTSDTASTGQGGLIL